LEEVDSEVAKIAKGEEYQKSGTGRENLTE
jgi:hypothetical protein